MTDEPDTLVEAEAALKRLGERRRELTERRTVLRQEIEGFSRGLDQADQDLRVRAVMRGDYGAGERRSLNRAIDEASEVEEQLRLVGLAIEKQKTELGAARRREARRLAAEIAPRHAAIVERIATALAALLDAQAAQRGLVQEIRKATGVEGVLPDFGRPLAGADVLLSRARECLANRSAAA
jgi:hypothetical protein